MFREASTFPFLFSHHIFTSLRAALSFVASRYLCLHRDAHLLLRRDIYDCTVMPIFCCATIFMIAPRCLSFVAPRYL
jgi:hypothetical protein